MPPEKPFACLTHEIFRYWIAKFHAKQKGKSVFISVNDGNEYVIFFKIDGGYISSSDRKADYMIYYHDFNNEKRYLLLIELKGSNVKDAIQQLETTINHNKIKNILEGFQGIKVAIVISHGGSPSPIKEYEAKFRKRYGISLQVFRRKRLDLREAIKRSK